MALPRIGALERARRALDDDIRKLVSDAGLVRLDLVGTL
jgi:hypothetical protein